MIPCFRIPSHISVLWQNYIEMSTKYCVGTSGFHYDHWSGLFYPEDLARTGWLKFYSNQFNTVELNSTFYRLPSEKAVASWRIITPPDFVFSVKVSRFITHIKRCRNVVEPVAKFVERARILGKKLGPLLYQLPANMKRDEKTLGEFLEILPEDLNHVFEFRNESWFQPPVFAILRRYNAGFCLYDMPGITTPLTMTAGFAYVRFHGSRRLYGSDYSNEELAGWAKKLASLDSPTTYIYFNNDTGAYAVKNAKTLRNMVTSS